MRAFPSPPHRRLAPLLALASLVCLGPQTRAQPVAATPAGATPPTAGATPVAPATPSAHRSALGQHTPGAPAPVVPASPPGVAVAPVQASGVGSAPAATPPATATTGSVTANEAGDATGAPQAAPQPAPAPVQTTMQSQAAASAVALKPIDPAALDPAPLQVLGRSAAALQGQLGAATGDPGLAAVRQSAAALETSATSLAAQRARTLAQVDADLKLLSDKAGGPRPHLSREDEARRRTLLVQRSGLQAQVRQAQAVGAEAGQAYNAVSSRRRNSFTSHIFERTASPLELGFWTSLADSLQPDAHRLGALASDAGRAAGEASEPRAALSIAFGLILALLVAWPLRLRLKAASRRRSAGAAGLRQSAHAVAYVLLDTLLPGAAALVVNLGLTWAQVLSEQAAAMGDAGVVAVFWAAAVVSLGRQLAAAGDADERLLPVSPELAARLKVMSWAVALTTAGGFLLYRLNVVVGASVAATIAANCVTSLAYVSVAFLVLLALGVDNTDGDDSVRAPLRVSLSLAITAAMAVSLVAIFAGFTTLGALVARQIYWIGVLGALAYLLLRFTDDLVGVLFRPQGWVGRMLIVVVNLRHSAVDQLGVLTSAVLRAAIALVAIGMALHPFGGSGGDLVPDVFDHFGGTVHVGSLAISPQSVGAGLLSLLIGLALVHLVERWIDRRFLPVTDWDPGVQNSVSTGVRYLGVGAAILWALAAAGLGFKQIALVASALSVGIGFGLQQIVQNFVSGLILLVERPVKVGDWINLGGVEGDVKRIRVRATEIETFDRTTVIVPNSDLITKQVQNKTLGDPRGRVSLRFSVGAAADAPRASEAALAVFADAEGVLEEPAPKVFIDSLTDGGAVNFVTYAYVASQRDVARLRSELYAALIGRFGQEGIGFVGGPTVNVLQPSPELRAFVDDLMTARPPGRDAQPT